VRIQETVSSWVGVKYMLVHVGTKSIQRFVASAFLDDRLRDTCIKESSGTCGTLAVVCKMSLNSCTLAHYMYFEQ